MQEAQINKHQYGSIKGAKSWQEIKLVYVSIRDYLLGEIRG